MDIFPNSKLLNKPLENHLLPCQLASLAFGFPKLRPDKQRNISEENMKVDFNLRYNDFFMIFKVGCHTIGRFGSQLQYYNFKHTCLIHMTFTFVPHFKLNSV